MNDESTLSRRLLRIKKTLHNKQLSRPDDSVDAVVAILILDTPETNLDTLLIHRAVRPEDPWSGQIGLPGGRVERSDASTKAALQREVLEEVGFDLDAEAEKMGLLSVSSPMRRLDFKVQPWVYGLRRQPRITIGPEVQSTFWVSLSRLPGLRTTTEVEIRGTNIAVNAFVIDGRVVWGFTYRVLNELLAIQKIPKD